MNPFDIIPVQYRLLAKAIAIGIIVLAFLSVYGWGKYEQSRADDLQIQLAAKEKSLKLLQDADQAAQKAWDQQRKSLNDEIRTVSQTLADKEKELQNAKYDLLARVKSDGLWVRASCTQSAGAQPGAVGTDPATDHAIDQGGLSLPLGTKVRLADEDSIFLVGLMNEADQCAVNLIEAQRLLLADRRALPD